MFFQLVVSKEGSGGRPLRGFQLTMNQKTRNNHAVKSWPFGKTMFADASEHTVFASLMEYAPTEAADDRRHDTMNRKPSKDRAVVRLTKVFRSLVSYLPAFEAGVVV